MLKIALKLLIIFWLKNPTFSSFYGEEAIDLSQTYVCQSLWCFQQMNGVQVGRKVDLQLLLLLSGDVEVCPGPGHISSNNPELIHLVKQKGLKCFHLNVRSLWNNLCNVMELLTANESIDIFCLSETHMQDEPKELYPINGYSFISKPQCDGLGGGIAIYISERINWTRRYDLESELECVWIEVFPIKAKSFLICAIYRPPDSSSYTYANFENLLGNMLSLATADSKEAIVMGDLNVNYCKKDNQNKSNYLGQRV